MNLQVNQYLTGPLLSPTDPCHWSDSSVQSVHPVSEVSLICGDLTNTVCSWSSTTDVERRDTVNTGQATRAESPRDGNLCSCVQG